MSNTKAECNCGGAVFRPGCPVHSYGHKTPSGPEGSLPTEPQTQAVTGATSTAEDKSSGPLLDQPKHSLPPTHTQASRDYEAAVERGKQIMPDQPSGLANEELTARAIVVWLAKQEPEIRKMGFASVALEALESKIARFTQQAVVAALEEASRLVILRTGIPADAKNPTRDLVVITGEVIRDEVIAPMIARAKGGDE